MELNLIRLEEHFKKAKYDINFSINLADPKPYLIFISGKLEHNSDRREYFSFEDLLQILEVNNITGPEGLYRKELKLYEDDLDKGLGDRNKRQEKLDSLLYDTLVKYITQVMSASLGRNFFPEIVPLEKHEDAFWIGRPAN